MGDASARSKGNHAYNDSDIDCFTASEVSEAAQENLVIWKRSYCNAGGIRSEPWNNSIA